MSKIVNAIITAGLVLLASHASAQQSCPSLATLVDQSLAPEVGSAVLVQQMYSNLENWTSNGLSARFDVQAAGSATGDRFRAAHDCPRRRDRLASPQSFNCRYGSRADAKISLDVDMREGEVTYLNPGRRFPGAVDNQVSSEAALATATQLAQALGVPPTEMALDVADTIDRVRITKTTGQPQSKVVRRAEVFVTIPRKVNGFPVHHSDFRVAIDTAGLPARAYVDWADFAPAASLAATRSLTRQEIITRIVEDLGALAPCGHFERMVAAVGWIEASLPGSDASAGRYIPGARLLAIPQSAAADSHRVTGFVHDLNFPIVEASGVASDG